MPLDSAELGKLRCGHDGFGECSSSPMQSLAADNVRGYWQGRATDTWIKNISTIRVQTGCGAACLSLRCVTVTMCRSPARAASGCGHWRAPSRFKLSAWNALGPVARHSRAGVRLESTHSRRTFRLTAIRSQVLSIGVDDEQSQARPAPGAHLDGSAISIDPLHRDCDSDSANRRTD